MGEHAPEPSQKPTPYTISRGWKAKLLVLGVKGVIVSRITGTERLVLSEPSPLLDSSDCTSVRCERVLKAVREDVLHCQPVSGGE